MVGLRVKLELRQSEVEPTNLKRVVSISRKPIGILKKDIWKKILDQLDCWLRLIVYVVYRVPMKNVKIRW